MPGLQFSQYGQFLLTAISLCILSMGLSQAQAQDEGSRPLDAEVLDAEVVAVLGDSFSSGMFTRDLSWLEPKVFWTLVTDPGGGLAGTGSAGKSGAVGAGATVSAAQQDGLSEQLSPLPLGRAHVLPRTQKDFRSAVNWIIDSSLEALWSRGLQTPEHSWAGYLAQGIGAKSLLVAARPHEGYRSIYEQVQRLLAFDAGRLPPMIVIFVQMHDVCSGRQEQMLASEDMKRHMLSALRLLQSKGRAHRSGTRVVMVGGINIAQLLIDEELRAKNVRAYGRSMSCDEVRAFNFALGQPNLNFTTDSQLLSGMGIQHLAPHPGFWCPGLALERPSVVQAVASTSTEGGADQAARTENQSASNAAEQSRQLAAAQSRFDERVAVVSNRLRSYRRHLKDVAESMQKEQSKGSGSAAENMKVGGRISWRYMDALELVRLRPVDIGQDCLHLSSAGHRRVASLLLQELGSPVSVQ